MIVIERLIKPKKSDSFVVLISLLKHFGVRYTDKWVNKSLEEHVEFPSLLAIKDVLLLYGIECEAIMKGQYKYSNFETPFVCSIQNSSWQSPMFTVVTYADGGIIKYINPLTHDEEEVDVVNFEQMDKEVVLLLDGEYAVDEVNYKQNRAVQLKENVLRKIPFLLFILPIMISIIYLFIGSGNLSGLIDWVSIAFLFTSSIGLITSVLLLWFDVDVHNPFLKEVCGGRGNKVSCGGVLKSKGASFFGVSWSILGFSYFASFFLNQLFYPGQLAQLTVWSMISLFVSPYIVYSVYYQWRVIKQWCSLCLTIQGLLLLNAIVSLIYVLYAPELFLNWYVISITFLTGFIFVIISYFAVPSFKLSKNSLNYERKWKKLLYNPEIFRILLQKSESITIPVGDIGIVIGNPEAVHEIIKVCNPYCQPCSQAHPELERIIRNNPDIRLRIIFTANGEEGDSRTPPVAHFLAIQQEYGVETVCQALDDWYFSDSKDYDLFAQKYPMNGELKQQHEKIKAMSSWCEAMKIRATPAVYIDSYEMPDVYHIHELKNIL